MKESHSKRNDECNVEKYGILFVNYLLNKVPKNKAEKTPYELWRGRQPSYKYLRVWGCLAKVAIT